MNDIYSKLYTDMAAHIAENMPEITWIDLYLGQDQTNLRPALAYPAVLIDFDRVTYSQTGMNNQFAELQMTVRLFLDNYASSAQKTSDKSKRASLSYFSLAKKLSETIHGYQPNDGYTQPLVRVSQSFQNRNDIGLRIVTTTFTTSFEEYISF